MDDTAEPRPEPASEAAPEPAPMSGRDRLRLTALLVPIGVIVVLGYVVAPMSPRLIVHHPAVLVALDARLRHLLLTVAGGIDPLPYFVFGFLRLVIADPLFFLLGWWYGQSGFAWAERQVGRGALWYYRWLDKAFRKAGGALVFVMPNQVVCLLAGTARMNPKRFAALNVAGSIARLGLLWWLGKAFESPLKRVLDWINRYQTWLIVAFVVLTIVQAGRGARGRIEQAVERAGEPATDGDR